MAPEFKVEFDPEQDERVTENELISILKDWTDAGTYDTTEEMAQEALEIIKCRPPLTPITEARVRELVRQFGPAETTPVTPKVIPISRPSVIPGGPSNAPIPGGDIPVPGGSGKRGRPAKEWPIDRVKDWITDLIFPMHNGKRSYQPMAASIILTEAQRMRLPERTLKRAKKALGLQSTTRGIPILWFDPKRGEPMRSEFIGADEMMRSVAQNLPPEERERREQKRADAMDSTQAFIRQQKSVWWAPLVNETEDELFPAFCVYYREGSELDSLIRAIETADGERKVRLERILQLANDN